MMQRSYLLLFWTIISFHSFRAYTQKHDIAFFEENLEEAKIQAKKENKLIFIDVFATWCTPCKQMQKYVFTDSLVAQTFNSSFINYKIDGEKAAGIEIVKQYGIIAYPYYLFIDASGELVHQIAGAVPPKKFIAEAYIALDAFKNYKSITQLEKQYLEGNRKTDFLYEYLNRKPVTDSKRAFVLDEYLKASSPATHRTEKVLTLISHHINSIESFAFQVVSNSLEYFGSMTPKQQNALIHGLSIAKRLSFKKAVEQKNEVLLEKLIQAVYTTSYSPTGAAQEALGFRLEYAKLTKNFENYRKMAVEEATKLMNKLDNELKEESETTLENYKQGAIERGIDPRSETYQMMLASLANSMQRATAYQLNDFAWTYYQLAHEASDVAVAVTWSRRALALEKTPANFDTYAHLLYKNGEKKEALKAEKQAIKLAKKMNSKTNLLEESLEKMRNNEL